MKRFIINTVAVLLITFAVLTAIGTWYEAQDVQTDASRRFKTMPRELDVACTGSSHSVCGYDFSEYPQYTTFNFGLHAQSLTYDCRLLNYYQDHLKAGGTVFITISYHTLSGLPETETDTFASKNRRYYGILPANLIKNYEIGYDIMTRVMPILLARGNFLLALLGLRAANPLGDRPADPADASVVVEDEPKGTAANETVVYSVNEEELAAVYDMIEICRKHEVRPILVTTPFLAGFTSSLKRNEPNFLPFFYGVIDEIVRRTGVQYLDYSHDERFRYDNTLFGDSHHLNRNGALKFTKILMDRVGLR